MKRKICIVTTNRAEFGQLKKLLKLIDDSNNSFLQLVVTGSHLNRKYGYTINEIKSSNIKIAKKIKLKLNGHLKSYQNDLFLNLFNKITKCFLKLKPDIVLVLGDRFEILSIAQACFFLNIPLAHLHGGEITMGVVDDTIRHLVTKMSDLHFVANDDFKKRVLRLGEQPKNVYNFGSLTGEQAHNFVPFKKIYLEEIFQFKFREKNILICLHPVRNFHENKKIIHNLKKAIEKFPNIFFIFTSPNFDEHSQLFHHFIKKYTNANPNCFYIKSIGYENFLSMLKYVDCIMGNSSSGITEAPILKVKTINIGTRQKGRPFSKSIITTAPTYQGIFSSINAIYNTKKKRTFKSFYYRKNTAKNILNILETKNLKEIKNKIFNDFVK
jgi:GDP/UDP-N,N'-diacetylbacillosamine 2-epimerase (hydrolysing)